MSRTITAMFNDRSEAEAAAAQLRTQIGGTEPRIIDQSSGSSASSSASGESGGFWADLKDMFVADDDRATYEEGVRRGHFMLSAQVPEEQADRACMLIDQAGAMDIDENEQKWRSEGWAGGSSSERAIGTRSPEQAFDNRNADATTQETAYSSDQSLENQDSNPQGLSRSGETAGRQGNLVQEERIPIIEEQLRVGKREVERGGARVRSYIEQRPVSEQVNLREEHVSVERRPVDEAISPGDIDQQGLLQERTIEMRETAEQAVVAKEARVKEEVVVQKTASEHTEQVEDTVRNTKVEVDEGLQGERSALGFEQDRQSGNSDDSLASERERTYDPSTTNER